MSLTARRSQRVQWVETGVLLEAVATAEEISRANGFCRTGFTEDLLGPRSFWSMQAILGGAGKGGGFPI